MASQPPPIKLGFSLPQFYYNSEELYRHEIDVLGEKQWLLLDHASQIPKPGDYVVHEIFGESIIVVRDNNKEIRAYYNVCRHRGSRICLEEKGRSKLLVCPYHSWSYNLDGTLRAATQMPPGFTASEYSLTPCHLGVMHGLIFVNLSKQAPPDFEQFSARFDPIMKRFGVSNTKIAHRQRYRTPANWKLVAENNMECYHCKNGHQTLARANPGMLGESDAAFENWRKQTKERGLWIEPSTDPPDSLYLQHASIFNLGDGAVSSTRDGKKAAPLLGELKEYGETSGFMLFNPISGLGTFSDYGFLYRFLPVSVSETDYEINWLVHEDAVEGEDYDLARLKDMWDVTTEEDKTLTMNNQLGVNSRAYRPGPYSGPESRVADFVAWYQKHFAQA